MTPEQRMWRVENLRHCLDNDDSLDPTDADATLHTVYEHFKKVAHLA